MAIGPIIGLQFSVPCLSIKPTFKKFVFYFQSLPPSSKRAKGAGLARPASFCSDPQVWTLIQLFWVRLYLVGKVAMICLKGQALVCLKQLCFRTRSRLSSWQTGFKHTKLCECSNLPMTEQDHLISRHGYPSWSSESPWRGQGPWRTQPWGAGRSCQRILPEVRTEQPNYCFMNLTN